MDNNGGASTVPGENGPILMPSEKMPNGEIENFDEVMQGGEGFVPGVEQPVETESVAAEVAPEQTVNAMPAMAAPVQEESDETVSKDVQMAQSIEIARDAESLPKEYVNAVATVIRNDKDDPAKLSSDCDILRWDLMKKAFGRNLGDGLNGNAAV